MAVPEVPGCSLLAGRCRRSRLPFACPPGLVRPDVVIAGEQVAGVVLTLDRCEPLVGLRWIDRGDILPGGRGEEVCVGAGDVRCESSQIASRTGRAASTTGSGPAVVVTNINSARRCA